MNQFDCNIMIIAKDTRYGEHRKRFRNLYQTRTGLKTN